MECFLEVDPEIWEHHNVLTFSMVYLRLLLVPFLVVCCLSCGAPGAGAYLEKIGFRMEGVSIFAFGPSARAAQQPRKRDEKSIAKSQNAQRTAHAERTRPHVKKSSFLGAQSSPKSTPRLPKATPEPCGSGWLANSAKIRDQEHPRDASKGFRVPPAGNATFAGGSE